MAVIIDGKKVAESIKKRVKSDGYCLLDGEYPGGI